MLVLSFLMVSLYDMNEREVRSMALNDNIKKIREEKKYTQQQLADKLYVSRQTCMPMGERFKMSRSNYSKKVSNGAWSHFG